MENTPLKPSDVQPAGVNYTLLGAVVPKQMTEEELVDPALWVNIGSKLRAGSEVRVIDVDCTFVARLFVTYVNQHDVRLSVIEHHTFETVDVDEDSEYYIKKRGVHRWCIMKHGSPDPIQKDIATRHEAERQLAEYLKTLAR